MRNSKSLYSLGIIVLLTGIAIAGMRLAAAQDNWKEEFHNICIKTDIAMGLTPEDLKELISRCDRLKLRIESEEESTKKVYLRRLQMCRDLYTYVLEIKGHHLP